MKKNKNYLIKIPMALGLIFLTPIIFADNSQMGQIIEFDFPSDATFTCNEDHEKSCITKHICSEFSGHTNSAAGQQEFTLHCKPLSTCPDEDGCSEKGEITVNWGSQQSCHLRFQLTLTYEGGGLPVDRKHSIISVSDNCQVISTKVKGKKGEVWQFSPKS